MGVVWADAQVPQREALQHARDAEATAKARGKNRFALRLVYAGGNHLEWSCPWAWLQPILSHYTDREGRSLRFSSAGRPPSWRHLAEDLQWLKGRQALTSARALWQVYFPALELPPSRAGSVAFRATAEQPEHERRFEQWLFDLGGVMAGLEKHRPACTAGAQP
jgi:CRISPR-associated protein Cmr2